MTLFLAIANLVFTLGVIFSAYKKDISLQIFYGTLFIGNNIDYVINVLK